jgi:two-component system OmpR family response regulator
MNEAILVVDESHATLMLAEKTLSAAGYNVRVAYDAHYAIELFEGFNPQLVLTDMLRADEVDGIELVRRLRANPQATHVAFVIATTDASEAERASAMAAGCDDFISEPLTTEMLCSLVADSLAAKACGSERLATVRNTSPGEYLASAPDQSEQPALPTYPGLSERPTDFEDFFVPSVRQSDETGPTYTALREAPADFEGFFVPSRRLGAEQAVATYRALTEPPSGFTVEVFFAPVNHYLARNAPARQMPMRRPMELQLTASDR